jgi:hypothetical protein
MRKKVSFVIKLGIQERSFLNSKTNEQLAERKA